MSIAMPSPRKRAYFSLLIFIIGLVLTIIAVQFSATRQFIINLGSSGIFGAFFGGILYAFAFTASLATVIFINIPAHLPVILIAIAGGIGSALYDMMVFAFIRQQTSHGFLQTVREAIHRRRPLPRWLSLVIGIIILGSPLPDELAAGFFGFMNFSVKKFIALSFVANTLGLYCIALLR